MEKAAKGLKAYALFIGIVVLLLGVICLFRPQAIEKLIIWILSGIVMITGIVYIVHGKSSDSNGTLVKGVVILAIGIVMIMCEAFTKTAIGIIIAIFAFGLGIDRLSAGSRVAKAGGNPKPARISGVLHIIFGGLMLFIAFDMIDFIMMCIGVYFIFAGITIISAATYFKDI